MAEEDLKVIAGRQYSIALDELISAIASSSDSNASADQKDLAVSDVVDKSVSALSSTGGAYRGGFDIQSFKWLLNSFYGEADELLWAGGILHEEFKRAENYLTELVHAFENSYFFFDMSFKAKHQLLVRKYEEKQKNPEDPKLYVDFRGDYVPADEYLVYLRKLRGDFIDDVGVWLKRKIPSGEINAIIDTLRHNYVHKDDPQLMIKDSLNLEINLENFFELYLDNFVENELSDNFPKKDLSDYLYGVMYLRGKVSSCNRQILDVGDIKDASSWDHVMPNKSNPIGITSNSKESYLRKSVMKRNPNFTFPRHYVPTHFGGTIAKAKNFFYGNPRKPLEKLKTKYLNELMT